MFGAGLPLTLPSTQWNRSLTLRLAVVLSLPVAATVMGYISFARLVDDSASDVFLLRSATQTATLAGQTVTWVDMVASGQDDREGLLNLVAELDDELRVLDLGDATRTATYSGLPRDLRPEFLTMQSEWTKLEPALTTVAREPLESVIFAEAASDVRRNSPALEQAAHRLLTAYELNIGEHQRSVQLTLLAITLTTFATLVLSLVAARQWIVRPLHRLRTVALRVGDGDLAARAPIPELNELADLSRAFNQMVVRQHDALNAINDERERSSTIVRSSPIGLAMVDTAHHVVEVNDAFTRLMAWGVPTSEALRDFLRSPEADHLLNTAQWTGHATLPTLLNLPDRRSARVQVVPLAHPRGHSLISLDDVTEEQRLRERERAFDVLVRHAKDAIITTDEDRRIASWNPAAAAIFGAPSDAALGRPLSEFVGFGASTDAAATSSRDLPELLAFEGRRANGEVFPGEATASHWLSSDQRHYGFILRDVTARQEMLAQQRELEERLQHAQKMEAVGQLASGIAHEINTPTQYSLDNLGFVASSLTKLMPLLRWASAANPSAHPGLEAALRGVHVAFIADETPPAIEQSIDGLGRIRDIVAAMKDYAHPTGLTAECFALKPVVDSAVLMARGEWRDAAEVTVDVDADLPLVRGSRNEISQLLLNLIVNAAQAIRMANQREAPGKIRVSAFVCGDWMELRVSDNGPGVPQQLRRRVFEPFFTTKDVGEGTGQGLALVHQVAARNGGSVQIEDAPGGGACFLVFLRLGPCAVEA